MPPRRARFRHVVFGEGLVLGLVGRGLEVLGGVVQGHAHPLAGNRRELRRVQSGQQGAQGLHRLAGRDHDLGGVGRVPLEGIEALLQPCDLGPVVLGLLLRHSKVGLGFLKLLLKVRVVGRGDAVSMDIISPEVAPV